MWPARHMHCGSFCVLCSADSHLEGVRITTRIRARMLCRQGENAVVTSGVDAALCVKEYMCLGAPTPLVVIQPL